MKHPPQVQSDLFVAARPVSQLPTAVLAATRPLLVTLLLAVARSIGNPAAKEGRRDDQSHR
jgi:hypothetical protein